MGTPNINIFLKIVFVCSSSRFNLDLTFIVNINMVNYEVGI